MARNWKEFNEGPAMTSPNAIYASLNHRGDIVINRQAFAELKEPQAVILLFDPDTDTIGLRPANPLISNAFRVSAKGNCGHRLITARTFTRKYDFRVDGTVRFPTAAIEDGVLVLELRNRVKVDRGRAYVPHAKR